MASKGSSAHSRESKDSKGEGSATKSPESSGSREAFKVKESPATVAEDNDNELVKTEGGSELVPPTNKMQEESQSTVEYESDEDPPSPAEEQDALWRLPPEESYSDWTIVIVTVTDSEDTEPETKVYHVHKGILAAGPRRCEYFTRLFQKEQISGTTRMELHELAANAFPAMLDFMYQTSDKLGVVTETATALHALGAFFENKRLQWEAKQFFKKDISVSNCHIYYEHAKIFEDEKILDQIARMVADRKNLLSLQTTSPLIMIADVDFWPTVLGYVNMREDASRHASRLIYQVIKVRSATMDVEIFEQLTDEKYLPYIDINVASHLLDAQDFFRMGEDESVLTSLQKRCVAAVAGNWLRLASAQNRSDFLTRQKPAILAELLDQVLQRAGDSVNEYKRTLEKVRARSSRSTNAKQDGDKRSKSPKSPKAESIYWSREKGT